MKPKISIITINYNNREGLERTFESVFAQTYQHFEYIVIDGGSTDGSKELIEKHSDQINYWVTEPDKGIYNAMNKGILQSNGEYLIFINSGDELYERETLERCAPSLHRAEIVSGNLKIVGADAERIGITRDTLPFELFYKGTLWHPCTFIKKSAFTDVGLYDEDLKIVSDWKWFMAAVCSHNLSYQKIHEVVAVFYQDGISSLSSSADRIRKERRDVLEESMPYLLKEYELRTIANLKLEGYESSRIVRIAKKLGFLKGL